MDDLTSRAFTAYFRAAKRQEWGEPDQPAYTSGVVEHKGLHYVMLENVNGPLAVYRVRNDGRLKQLRRWPEALTAA